MHFGATLTPCHYFTLLLHPSCHFEGSLDEASDSMGSLISEAHCLHVPCICAFLLQCLCHCNVGLLVDPHWVEPNSLVSDHISLHNFMTVEMASH